MADDRFVLCNPLCFLVNKYGKNQVKLLKSALVDFYSPKVLSAARKQLLKDVETVIGTLSLPHMPQQRHGDNHAVREVDDMIAILTALDEKMTLSMLPAYMSDSPDNMPSLRLYEGDLGVLMAMLEKMDSRLAMLESAVSYIPRPVTTNTTSNLHTTSVTGEVNKVSACVASQSRHMGENTQSTKPRDTERRTAAAGTVAMMSGNPTTQPLINTGNDSQMPVGARRVDWSSVASAASTPVMHNNRYSVLMSNTEDSDNNQFVEQRSATTKRRRHLAAQQRRQQQQPVANNNAQSVRPTRAPVMIGKSTTQSAVSAAKKIFKKSVYCVDNVSTSYTDDDICSHVTAMGVTVVSCHEVKPRRRRPNEDVSDRKAFRLCISTEDNERLLDADKWPDSVTICEWFFKPQQSQTAEKRPRLASPTVPENTKDTENVRFTVAGYGQQISARHERAMDDESVADNDDAGDNDNNNDNINENTIIYDSAADTINSNKHGDSQ